VFTLLSQIQQPLSPVRTIDPSIFYTLERPLRVISHRTSLVKLELEEPNLLDQLGHHGHPKRVQRIPTADIVMDLALKIHIQPAHHATHFLILFFLCEKKKREIKIRILKNTGPRNFFGGMLCFD